MDKSQRESCRKDAWKLDVYSFDVRGHVVPNFLAEKLLFVPRFYNYLILYSLIFVEISKISRMV